MFIRKCYRGPDGHCLGHFCIYTYVFKIKKKDQGATMVDILSENSRKEYTQSVTELLRLEKKRVVQEVCYFINKIPKFT
jgi:hypothetical protein